MPYASFARPQRRTPATQVQNLPYRFGTGNATVQNLPDRGGGNPQMSLFGGQLGLPMMAAQALAGATMGQRPMFGSRPTPAVGGGPDPAGRRYPGMENAHMALNVGNQPGGQMGYEHTRQGMIQTDPGLMSMRSQIAAQADAAERQAAAAQQGLPNQLLRAQSRMPTTYGFGEGGQFSYTPQEQQFIGNYQSQQRTAGNGPYDQGAGTRFSRLQGSPPPVDYVGNARQLAENALNFGEAGYDPAGKTKAENAAAGYFSPGGRSRATFNPQTGAYGLVTNRQYRPEDSPALARQAEVAAFGRGTGPQPSDLSPLEQRRIATIQGPQQEIADRRAFRQETLGRAAEGRRAASRFGSFGGRSGDQNRPVTLPPSMQPDAEGNVAAPRQQQLTDFLRTNPQATLDDFGAAGFTPQEIELEYARMQNELESKRRSGIGGMSIMGGLGSIGIGPYSEQAQRIRKIELEQAQADLDRLGALLGKTQRKPSFGSPAAPPDRTPAPRSQQGQ